MPADSLMINHKQNVKVNSGSAPHKLLTQYPVESNYRNSQTEVQCFHSFILLSHHSYKLYFPLQYFVSGHRTEKDCLVQLNTVLPQPEFLSDSTCLLNNQELRWIPKLCLFCQKDLWGQKCSLFIAVCRYQTEPSCHC